MSHLRELISAHLDGELDPEESSRVVAHLAGCPSCSAELEETAAARAMVRGLPDPTATGYRVDVSRRRPGRGRRVAAAAATLAAAALAGAVALGPGVAEAPFDLDALVEQHTARVVVDPVISTLRGPVGGP